MLLNIKTEIHRSNDTFQSISLLTMAVQTILSAQPQSSFRPTTESFPSPPGVYSARAAKGGDKNKTHTDAPPGKRLYGVF